MQSVLKTFHGDHIIMYVNADSLCYTLGTNITMYVNYTSVKKICRLLRRELGSATMGKDS